MLFLSLQKSHSTPELLKNQLSFKYWEQGDDNCSDSNRSQKLDSSQMSNYNNSNTGGAHTTYATNNDISHFLNSTTEYIHNNSGIPITISQLNSDNNRGTVNGYQDMDTLLLDQTTLSSKDTDRHNQTVDKAYTSKN